MNKVFLIGNLTRNPELAETSNGIKVCRLSVAVNRVNSEGVDYFGVSVWRTQAENCAKYLTKGRKISVVGTLQNKSYEDKDGIKRNVTEIVAQEVEFLSPREEQKAPAQPKEPQQQYIDGFEPPKRRMPTLTPVDDDNLPF